MPKKPDDEVMDDYGRKGKPAERPITVILPQGFAQGFQPYAQSGQRVMYPADGSVLGDAGVDNRLAHIVGGIQTQQPTLDPSIVAYLQQRPMQPPPPPQNQPTMSQAPYIHPAIAEAVQRGLPAYASGGIVTEPTVGLIGENGPEAIVPLDPSIDAAAQTGFDNVQQQPALTSPPVDVPSVTGGQLVSAPTPQAPPATPPQSSPDFQVAPPTSMPVTDAQVAKSNAVYAKAQAAQAKQAAAEAAQAATPEALAKKAAADEMAHKEEQARIAQQVGDQQAAESKQLEDLKLKQIADRQALDAQQEQARMKQAADEKAAFDDKRKAVDAAANLKVDPNRYWNDMSTGKHISTGIGIALSGLGQGFMAAAGHSVPNMAMEMVKGAIERDVDAQKANIGQANQTAAAKGELFQEQRQLGQDAEHDRQMEIATGLEKAAQQVELTALHYKGPQQQLAAQSMAAELRGQKDKILATLAQQQVANQHAAGELAVAKQNANTASFHASIADRQEKYAEKTDVRDFDEKKREFDQNLAERYLTAKSTGNATAAKQIEGIRKYGLRDPSTGNLILDEQGEAKMKRADQLEVQARGKPQAVADALRTQAQAIRDDAEQSNHIEHEKAPEQQEKLNFAQTGLEQVADLRRKLKDDPGMTDRKAWASILANSELLKVDTIKSMGMNASSREMAAFEGVAGPNGDKLLDRDFSVGKMEAHLDAIEKALKSDSDAILRGTGYKGSFHLGANEGDTADQIGGKTSVEAATGAEKGFLGRNLPDADLKFRSNAARSRQAEESTPSGPTGLAPEDTAKVASLIARYHNATDAEQGKILTTLTAFAQSDREAVANGAIGLIRSNPEVYQQVLSVLPPDTQEKWRQFDSAGAGPVAIPGQPPKPAPFTPKGGIPR